MDVCNTVDDGQKWKSTVKGAPDGDLTINRAVNGKFDGKHEDSKNNLYGECREASGKPHKIWFRVQNTKDLYVGIFMNNKKIEGLKLQIDQLGDTGGGLLNGGEDWVAVKT